MAEAVLGTTPAVISDALSGSSSLTGLSLLAVGTPASPGVGSGPLALSVEAAFDLIDAGETPVLVVAATSPADEPALRAAAAVVTTGGGFSSHAAIVARSLGVPAVCGAASLHVSDLTIEAEGLVVRAGEDLSVDGDTGEIRLGLSDAGPQARDLPSDLIVVLAVADRLATGGPVVTADVHDGAGARRALELGAVGIGLVRTEHLFLGEGTEILRSLLVDEVDDPSSAAAEQFEEVQRAAFVELFDAAEGRGVTIRLLDAPTHEFGPVDRREVNPMLGMRGVRLAAVRPDIARRQVAALAGAIDEVRGSGAAVRPRLLVPMVNHGAELVRVAELVREHRSLDGLPLGAMVETPRAALVTDELVRHADFVSYGTNDLTQLALGASRDDVPASAIGGDPFRQLDRSVASLIRTSAAATGSAAELGMCGELATTVEALEVARELRMATVTGSVLQIPVARLRLGQLAAREALGVC